MANKKITDLTANGTLADTDLLWKDTAGSAASQKITGAELKAGYTPLTTKGDLLGFSTVDARLPIGTDDYVLTADAAEPTGMKWAAAAGGGGGFSEIVDNTTAGTYGIGVGVLAALTNGFGNLAFGDNAGAATSFQDRNIYIGEDCGKTAAGFDNVYAGYQVGDAGVGGDKNTILGALALTGTGTSARDNNTGTGYKCLDSLVSGKENSVFGALSGDQISSGTNNTFGGFDSGTTVTTGSFNSFFGNNSGDQVVTGSYNLGYGVSPGSGSWVSGDQDRIIIGNVTSTVGGVAIIDGQQQARSDIDVSAQDVTITGTSAYASATTNQDGGNLVLQGGLKATGGGTNGLIVLNNIPTSDPSVAGAIWNNSGVLTISAG